MRFLLHLAMASIWVLSAAEIQVYVDLSGDWMRYEDGVAARPFRLPTTTVAVRTSDKPFRLERAVTLPDTGLRGLAILMMPLSRPYVIRVNGAPIGGQGTPDSWLSPTHEPVVLPVPDGLLHPGDNRIEIEVGRTRMFFRGQGRLPDGGPLLGSETVLRPIAEGRIRTRQLRFVYLPVNCGLQLLFAAILWAMSRGSRYRGPLRLMALFFFLQVLLFDAVLTFEYYAGLSPAIWDLLLPFDSFWAAALLTETALALGGVSLPLVVRLGYYVLVAILGATDGYYNAPRLWIPVAVDAWLLWKVLPTRRPLAIRYLALLLGYGLIQAGLLPPIELPPLLTLGPLSMHIVPGYRIAIGLLFILFMARQAAQDRSERERLASELEAARAMQQLLLPKAEAPGVEAVYQPAAEVGGDFYYVEPQADGALLVVVGDVSGKGLKAAMLVSMLIGALRRDRPASPGEVLAGLNETLVGYAGGGFVTCCCARFGPDGSVVAANAGHPPPYVDGREIEVAAGLPLGVVSGAAYEESRMAGEYVTFVSDGVIEAENAQRELFGFERTREISTKSAAEIAEAARAWGQNDDITVVTVVRRRG